MLVVKAEIWPQGNTDEQFEIARIGITNITGRQPLADYTVVGILGRDHEERVMQGTILAHARRLGWRPLVARTLTEPQADLLHPEYVQTAAKLLRRG